MFNPLSVVAVILLCLGTLLAVAGHYYFSAHVLGPGITFLAIHLVWAGWGETVEVASREPKQLPSFSPNLESSSPHPHMMLIVRFSFTYGWN